MNEEILNETIAGACWYFNSKSNIQCCFTFNIMFTGNILCASGMWTTYNLNTTGHSTSSSAQTVAPIVNGTRAPWTSQASQPNGNHGYSKNAACSGISLFTGVLFATQSLVQKKTVMGMATHFGMMIPLSVEMRRTKGQMLMPRQKASIHSGNTVVLRNPEDVQLQVTTTYILETCPF